MGEAAPQARGGIVSDTGERLTLTVPEAAAALGISTDAFYDACRHPDSGVPHVRVGRRIVVPKARFLAWLAGEGRTGT